MYIQPRVCFGRHVGTINIQNNFVKKHETKSGLPNYIIIKPNGNSCIKFINIKVNSLQTCDIAQNYRIIH
jgi:hypothetical protein